MKSHFGASLSFALAAFLTSSAFAAELPEVKLSASNKVPSCATPERLSAYLKERNPRLDPRFSNIAALYKKHGEQLGIRWDIAFFQMILETGALRFTGDVRADQNNFAGLGASGGGAHGERFADISTGVKAHLQHLLMYAGEHIDDPVADRTRKVQEWGVLTDWQKSVSGPMTYTLVARQWAPTSRNYVRDVSTITDEFYARHCSGAGSNPAGTQEAKQTKPKAKAKATAVAAVVQPEADDAQPGQQAEAEATDQTSGAEIAKRNIEEERQQNGSLEGLGAGTMASVDGSGPKTAAERKQQPENLAAAEDSPPVTLLNGDQNSAPAEGAATSEKKQPTSKADAKPKAKADTKAAAKTTPAPDADKGAAMQTASIAGAATQLKVPPAKGGKCKVFTASYGGQRAVIIKASASGIVNYTVLDVTDANEKREVEAYIAAYAKGGETVGTFPTQTKALTKAFELCPEG